jgi:hypothetical protein
MPLTMYVADEVDSHPDLSDEQRKAFFQAVELEAARVSAPMMGNTIGAGEVDHEKNHWPKAELLRPLSLLQTHYISTKRVCG